MKSTDLQKRQVRFHKTMQTTPYSYVMEVRLSKAANLLARTELSVGGRLKNRVPAFGAQAAVLRLLVQSPWTAPYSTVHRTVSVTVAPSRVRLPHHLTGTK